jgi:hypothetical protein
VHIEPEIPKTYGLLAEFDDVNALTEAARRTYAEGYRKTDAYSPFPIEPVWEALGVHDRPVSMFVLCGGIVGMFAGFGDLFVNAYYFWGKDAFGEGNTGTAYIHDNPQGAAKSLTGTGF